MNVDLLLQSPVFILGIPLLFAFLTPLADKVSKELRNAVFIIGLLLTALFVSLMAYEVYTIGSWTYVFGAEDPTAITDVSFFRITFLADGFAVLATLTIIITAVGVGIYSFGNMKDFDDLGKFYTLFLLTLAGVMGMVLTSDLFNLFVWFEVTSIASCGLIAYHNERGESVEAALKYMIISVIAGLLLLFSIGFFYGEYGVLNYFLIRDSMDGAFIDILAIGLVMVILSMKASSVPMHMWAPDAYSEAPDSITPFIAITSLGSLFVLFRLIFFVFRGAVEPSSIGNLLIILGVLSMFVGVSMALKQSDVKRLIAYLSVSQIGYMMMAVGVGFATLGTADYGAFGVNAVEGGFFHMINDGVYKALLFLSVGGIIYAADTRDLNRLGGLAHSMPFTTFFFIIGGLSIAGIPPLSGFSSKLLIYKSVYLYNPVLAIIALVVSIVTLALIGKIFFNAFLGPDQKIGMKIPRSMILSMGVLTVIIVIFSLFPNYVVSEIIAPAIEALGVAV